MAETGSSAASEQAPLLARLGDICREQIGADHAAVAVAVEVGGDLWLPAYATDDTAERLEQYAFTVGEGPCYDSLREHVTVQVPDLDSPAAAIRWPAWAAEAVSLEVRSVASIPIQAGAVVAGALTLYFTRRGMLSEAALALGLRVADAAFVGLLDAAAGAGKASKPSESWQFDPAGVGRQAPAMPLFRAEVHQAAGVIMVQSGVPIAQALARLRAAAFSSGRPIAEVAADVVAGRLRFESDKYPAE